MRPLSQNGSLASLLPRDVRLGIRGGVNLSAEISQVGVFHSWPEAAGEVFPELAGSELVQVPAAAGDFDGAVTILKKACRTRHTCGIRNRVSGSGRGGRRACTLTHRSPEGSWDTHPSLPPWTPLLRGWGRLEQKATSHSVRCCPLEAVMTLTDSSQGSQAQTLSTGNSAQPWGKHRFPGDLHMFT